MTVAAEERTARCVDCGKSFVLGGGRGRPRRHCVECQPRSRAKVAAPRKRRKTSGDPFTVEHFVAWARRLRLDSGAKWVLDPFQEAFVADVFSGVPELWLVVPEGNGKSTLIAGLALYHIEHREDARVPVAASARDQAGIIYRQADGFVRRNKLETVFRPQRGYRRIECEAMRSTIQIHAADAGTADGEIFTFGLIDELHRHGTLELYRTWNGKLDKRPGAQLVVISTAGEPGGEFEAERDLLRQTADDVTRDGCFVRAASATSILHEYAVPEDGDVEDVALVAEANPLASVTAATLAAKRKRIRHLGHWKRFTCNIATRGDQAAIAEVDWFAAATDIAIPEREPVWVGLDLGWKYDTTAAVPLWIRDEKFRLFGPAKVLVPPRDGSMMEPERVRAALREIHERNPVDTVVMDMTDGAETAAWIESELGCQVIDRGQSNAYACLDYARFTEALRLGWLKHSGDAALTKHALNAVARMLPGGDVRFDRPRANRKSSYQDMRVIDALAAAAMVHTAAAADFDAAPVTGWRGV